ncbi:hypothetical protein [uncultured Arthrobacter sp.]|uniref:hypothetical protein n=1 Tax=uncultured Arthrobacter sp. TaxID=114050 RepID=UPI002610CF8F|nr:hypothetical protein [uncultured Arthrobacter sp.]
MTGSALVQEGEVLRSSAPDETGRFVEYPIDESIPVLLRPELRTAENIPAAPTPASTATTSASTAPTTASSAPAPTAAASTAEESPSL